MRIAVFIEKRGKKPPKAMFLPVTLFRYAALRGAAQASRAAMLRFMYLFRDEIASDDLVNYERVASARFNVEERGGVIGKFG